MQATVAPAPHGLTLIELTITIALLVIVIVIGLPSLQGAINAGRLTSAANELSAALQLARAEATRRNRSVVLCRSETLAACANGDTWSGWLVFVDTDGDGAVDGGEEIVKTGTVDTPLVMRASPAVASNGQAITILPGGLARGVDEMALLNGALSVCTPFAEPAANVRDVLIAFGSRVSVRNRGTAGDCGAAPADS